MSEIPLCWCCAQWGLTVPAAAGQDTCARCAGSSPSACKNRHIAEALKAGADARRQP